MLSGVVAKYSAAVEVAAAAAKPWLSQFGGMVALRLSATNFCRTDLLNLKTRYCRPAPFERTESFKDLVLDE